MRQSYEGTDGLKKGPWTPEEDIALVSYIMKHGPGNWLAVPENTGLRRCNKSCRLRWTNYLRPDIKHESFSPIEEQMIINLQSIFGNRWTTIAKYLPHRTGNAIKNYWNRRLKKKLLGQQMNGNQAADDAEYSNRGRYRGHWERDLHDNIESARQALAEAVASAPTAAATLAEAVASAPTAAATGHLEPTIFDFSTAPPVPNYGQNWSQMPLTPTLNQVPHLMFSDSRLNTGSSSQIQGIYHPLSSADNIARLMEESSWLKNSSPAFNPNLAIALENQVIGGTAGGLEYNNNKCPFYYNTVTNNLSAAAMDSMAINPLNENNRGMNVNDVELAYSSLSRIQKLLLDEENSIEFPNFGGENGDMDELMQTWTWNALGDDHHLF